MVNNNKETMTLDQIKSMPVLDFLKSLDNHRKTVTRCRFYAIRRSEWNDFHKREYNHLLETGTILKEENETNRKERLFIYNGKEEIHWNEIHEMHPDVSINSVLNAFKRQGFYRNRAKTVTLTRNEESSQN